MRGARQKQFCWLSYAANLSPQAQRFQDLHYIREGLLFVRAGALIEPAEMSDADADQRLRFEVVLDVKNESSVKRQGLNRAMLSRVADNFATRGTEVAQCRAEIAIFDRDGRRTGKLVPVKINVESRADSSVDGGSAKRSLIQHDVERRYFEVRSMSSEKIARGVLFADSGWCFHGDSGNLCHCPAAASSAS